MSAAMLAVAAAVIALAIAIAALFVVATRAGTETRREIRECHARGPAYHYWQERKRCVVYLSRAE